MYPTTSIFLKTTLTCEKNKNKNKNPSLLGDWQYRKYKCACQVKEKNLLLFPDRRHLLWKLLNSKLEIFILNSLRYSRFHLNRPFMVLSQEHALCTNKIKPSLKLWLSDHERWYQALGSVLGKNTFLFLASYAF